jgi:hypothetical protein
MHCHNPERTYRTTDGLRCTIVPSPRFLGVILDASGKPEAVKYPDYRESSKAGYRPISDLKGINREDFDRIKPDRVLYKLGDGTLLEADLKLFVSSEMGSHNATQKETACYNHPVNRLRVVEMPAVEAVPVYSL